MKRYTLSFRPSSTPISTDILKDEVDRLLLRLHPRITYKMGQVFLGEDGIFLAQIMADGKRPLLAGALSRHDWALPVHFESLRWGWVKDNEEPSSIIFASKSIEVDPLRGIEPLDGEASYSISKRFLHARYIALVVSTLALILILIGDLVYTKSAWLMALYAIVFALFMFSLSDTPLDLRVYGEKISLRSDGLELKFWLLSKPVFLAWEYISTMDYTHPVCELSGRGVKLRFLLSEQFGCKDQAVVLGTIMSRSGLRFVEGNFRKLTYRRPDALEEN